MAAPLPVTRGNEMKKNEYEELEKSLGYTFRSQKRLKPTTSSSRFRKDMKLLWVNGG